MNQGMFSGNLGRDAEKSILQNGEILTKFALAVQVGKKDAPKAMWIDCVIWGKRGESLMPYLQKGTKVTVIGRITTEEFAKKDGSGNGFKVCLNVSELDLNSVPNQSAPQSAHHEAKANGYAPKNDAPYDDDLPF